MMSTHTLLATALLVFSLFGSTAQAHFLWVVADAPVKNFADSSQNRPGKIQVYFSESATADDPELLTRVKHAKVWYREKNGNVSPAQVAIGNDALETGVEQPFDVAGVSCSYGVLERQGETFLLEYSGKSYTQEAPLHWQPISNIQILPLELHPARHGEKLIITATWQGQPTANVAISVSSDQQARFELITNDQGQIEFVPVASGLLSIRGKYVEQRAGEHDGKPFQAVRHYSTLSLKHNSKHISMVLPPVTAPITSFGGAVVGNTIYAYGGNTGKAHRYVPSEQSGVLYKLEAGQLDRWQEVSTGPRRTGLALVPYHNTVIRIGGFDVRNEPGEDKNLWSTTDVSQFDIQTGTWSDLPPMPTGRSSFDAAVVGNDLYVIGGWCLNGSQQEPTWHKSMLVMDLTNQQAGWQTLPQPFERRALAVAAVGTRLFVLGGMTSDDETTAAVEIFDSKTGVWTSGPALPATHEMDGFGTSAIAFDNQLYATTMSGKLHRLDSDSLTWQHIANMNEPRFFHRLLAVPDLGLIAFGGSSMATGKATSSEVFAKGLLSQLGETPQK
jgi:Kelch motif